MNESGNSEAAAAVRRFLEEDCLLEPEEIRGDTPLFSSGRLTSLVMIELVSFLEQEFRIVIDTVEIAFDRFDTLDRIVDFVAEAQRDR